MKNKGAILNLTRREFAKLSAAISLFPWLMASRCSVDAVIAALDVASKVAKGAASILASVSPKLNAVLLTVADDLSKVVTLYREYDSAAGDKPTKLQLLQATVSTITNNLSEILTAVHVFNPALQIVIKTAVAIVNTAISLIISHLPAQHKAQMQTMRLNLPALPMIDGAKNAADLKRKWNETVKAEYPSAVVQ